MAKATDLVGLTPACTSSEQFFNYYPNRHQSIRKGYDAQNWVSLGKFTYLSDEQILEAIDGATGAYRGLRWGDQTRFAVLDIDKDSEYHNAHSLKRIARTLSEAGIKHIQKYQSSISGGWHLYIGFDRFVESEEAEYLLKSYLKANDFKIISGQLEVFPSGNGLRLPLQKGFAWLADDGTIAVNREELTTEHAIKKFVLDIEYGANDWDYTKLRINEELEQRRQKRQQEAEAERELRISTDGMDELFVGRVIQENYDQGKQYFQEGLKSKGERHNAVICVEHYLWHGDDSIGLRSYAGRANDYDRYEAIVSWLQKKHNGFCNHINRGDWKTVEAQITRAVNWRSEEVPERTPYLLSSDQALDRIISLTKSTGKTWTPADWRKANERRKKTARKKIERAVEKLNKSGAKLSIRKVSEISGCHRSTVKKHADLLSSGLCDLEPGGVGGFGSEQSKKSENLVDLPERENFEILPLLEIPETIALVKNSASSEFSEESEIFVSGFEREMQPVDTEKIEEIDFANLLNNGRSEKEEIERSENLGDDPVVRISKNFDLAFDKESRKYIDDINYSEGVEEVISIAPGSSIRKEQKDRSEELKIVVFENGQLAIDFENVGFSPVRKRKDRGPP